MPVYLKEIVDRKKVRLEERNLSIDKLRDIIRTVPKQPSFYEALKQDGLSIIGEIKKASPSKGLIRDNFKPIELAREYENCVEAISVLTEEDYFLGADKYLQEVSNEVVIPTLCKDFIINPLQIYNAKALGASCVLLIVNILSDNMLKEFVKLAGELELDVLVETHTKNEIVRALKAGAVIIGVNNRNLTTFETSIDVTLKLAKHVPKDCIIISESGILSYKDVELLSSISLDGILVGESFMKSDDIVKSARELKEAYTKGRLL